MAVESLKLSIAEKFRIQTLPDHREVDRKFCVKHCCAWRGGWCGAEWGPEYRRGKCLWSLEEIKAKRGQWLSEPR